MDYMNGQYYLEKLAVAGGIHYNSNADEYEYFVISYFI